MRSVCRGEIIELAMRGCKAEEILSAKLCRPKQWLPSWFSRRCCGNGNTHYYGDYTFYPAIDVPVVPNSYKVGPLPDNLCAGVWKLIVRTPCGCHHEFIQIHCEQLKYPDSTEVTNLRPTTVVCCPTPPTPSPAPSPTPTPSPTPPSP